MRDTILEWALQHRALLIGVCACLGAWIERVFVPSRASKPRRVFGNGGLMLLWVIVATEISTLIMKIYSRAQHPFSEFTLCGFLKWPSWAEAILTILIFDFVNYTIHRTEHRVPFLWRFHRVHHSDPYVDLSTAVRKHPLTAVYTTSIYLVTYFLLGCKSQYVILFGCLAEVSGLFVHSTLPFPRPMIAFLQKVRIITPRDHILHHSQDQNETDSNFGQLLSVWDRLFKTYRTRKDGSDPVLGLKDFATPQLNEFPGVLWSPLK